MGGKSAAPAPLWRWRRTRCENNPPGCGSASRLSEQPEEKPHACSRLVSAVPGHLSRGAEADRQEPAPATSSRPGWLPAQEGRTSLPLPALAGRTCPAPLPRRPRRFVLKPRPLAPRAAPTRRSAAVVRSRPLGREAPGADASGLPAAGEEEIPSAKCQTSRRVCPRRTLATQRAGPVSPKPQDPPMKTRAAPRTPLPILLSLLLPRQNRLRTEIEEALDTDLLKQEAEHGALKVLYLSKYVLNMMALLCAPLRDEAVQKLENITDPVWLLRGIFQVLGLMKMDMVNYTIQSLQPHLQEHSIQYERAKFQELLNKQPSLLNHTTKWLTQAAADLTMSPPTCPDTSDSSSLAGPSPNEATNNSEPLSPTMVLCQGFLNLLLWDPENEEFPETLLMDRTRLQELKSQLHQLTIMASVLLVASSFSGSVLFGSPQFVDKLKRITKSLLEDFHSRPEEAILTVSEQVSQEIHQSLKNMGLVALSSDNTASLMGQLQNIAKKENCVHSVIDQRIRLFLKCCLVLGVQRSLLDLPGGLTLIEAELAELGQKFVNLTHHNQQVFGPYYTEILETLISPTQALETKVESV
uniref:T-complex 11 n=5 Tax=Cercopithecinae TaxID=9528 RepID=A0A1D5Q379_MACMU